MPVTLHLGVDDVPYQIAVPQQHYRVSTKARKGGKPTKHRTPPSGGQTTGDIAEILEAKYHVMESFFELHAQEIANDLAVSMKNSLEDALSGGPANYQLADSEGFIKTLFTTFIDSKEMDGLGASGVPTAASLRGVNHRLQHPFAKGNPARPSFRDTGTYSAAMRAWIET